MQEIAIAGFPLALVLLGALAYPTSAPDDTALFVFASALFGCSSFLLIRRLRRRRSQSSTAASIVYGGFVLFYSYPAFLFSTLDPPSWLDAVVSWRTLIAVGLFFVALAIGLRIRVFSTDGGVDPCRERRGEKFIAGGALCLTFLGLAPYLAEVADPSHLLALILASRTTDKPWLPTLNLGSAETLIPAVSVMALVAGASMLTVHFLFRSKGRATRTAGLLLVVSVVGVVVLDHGTRVLLLLVFGPATILYLRERHLRFPLRTGITLVALVVAGLWLGQYVASARALTASGVTRESVFEDWYLLGGSIDFFSETVFSVALVPSQRDYFHESTTLLFLTYPIPRAVWAGKPVSSSVRYYVLERWGQDVLVQAGNVFPGIVGQQYLSWGLGGVFLAGMLFGLVGRVVGSRVTDRVSSADLFTSACWLMLAIWLFTCFRLLSPVFLVPVVLSFLLVRTSRMLGQRNTLDSRRALRRRHCESV